MKENSNPQIFLVEKERAHTRRAPLRWSQLGTFRTGPGGDEIEDMEDLTITTSSTSSSSSQTMVIPTSAHDKAVFKALVECSRATNGKGVNLLRQAGLVVPNSVHHHAVDGTTTNGPIFQVVEDDDPIVTTTRSQSKSQQQKFNDKLTADEVFDIIRNIQDPEHPHTLEQLGVVSLEQVELVGIENTMGLENGSNATTASVNVRFTPTIPHCSMATLIGLCIRVKLLRSLPPGRFKVSVQIEPGTHASENAINKQLRDKERVCAALENKHLAGVVNKCIRNGMVN
jgi:metal-sulfur cluster biosynthetic enzyme